MLGAGGAGPAGETVEEKSRLTRPLWISRGDVVVDEGAETCRQFVIGSAQRGEVLAVHVDRTVWCFACAGKADADVRRLRFTGSVDHAAHHGQREGLDAFVRGLPAGHLLANVILGPFRQLLERAAGRAAAARTRGDARRE